MANKTVCDRCGKEFNRSISHNFEQHLYLKEFALMGMTDIDLCYDCEKGLYDWLENKERKECNCNKNIIEILDQLEAAEKRICVLEIENAQSKEQIELLKDGAIERLLKNCHIRLEFDIEGEE